MNPKKIVDRLARRRRSQHFRSKRASFRRGLVCESLEDRRLLAGDAVLDGLLKVRFEYADASGVVDGPLQVGQNYTLRTYVQDIRDNPTGVRNAYLTIDYNNVIDVTSNAIQSPLFSLDPDGDGLSTPGKILEAGGIDTDVTPPFPAGTEELLFSISFSAIAAGTLDFDLTQEASIAARRPLFFDSGTTVPLSEIDLVCDTIEIVEAGVRISPTSGLITTEAGGTDTFDVVLTVQPTADVSFSLSSNNTLEGTVSTSSLIFTTANWDVPQTVTVTGVDDLQDDGDVGYTIVTSDATSGDPRFDNFNVADVQVVNTNDDTSGVLLSPPSGLVTSEAGGGDSFNVSLTSQPTSDVTIALSSSNENEGTISTNSLLFTAANWNVPQSVTVTGVDDAVDDGDTVYNIVTAAATSSDPVYNNFDAADVSVTNIDNDAAGITVNPLSGLTTSEAGGTQTFSVRLDSEPTADVVIAITSSNEAEGTVSDSSLTFTALNWDTAQIVTITGVDDDIDDGDQSYQIITAAAASGDGNYDTRDAADVSVTNTDDDTAGFIVEPVTGLITTEAGGTDTFTVRLSSQPTADVTIDLSVSLPQEGSLDVTSLQFTAANWDQPQTVTITGQDDDIDDGNVAFVIVTAPAVSDDTTYTGLNPEDVSVTNNDDDVAGITVAPTSGLITGENGNTTSFDVVLTSEPTSLVTIGLASSDASEGTVNVDSLSFDQTNWSVPQTVTITGVDDNVDDGDIAYTILTSNSVSADANYSNRDVADVSVINTDDDAAGVQVAPTSGLITSEAGGSATFTLQLTAQPSDDVTISLASSNSGEGSVSASSVTFTNVNWNVAQEVTVTGVDDEVVDGDIAYTIQTGVTVSSDVTFNGLVVDDVQVTNTDDDNVEIVIQPIAGLVTSEAGQTASFQVSLGSQPTADVTIGLSSNNTNEGTLNVTSLTFTAGNWDTPQSVTVTGVDDFVDDGDIEYQIVTAAAVSADAGYNGLDGADIAVTNTNDDTAGVLVQPVAGLQTTEAGGTATFTVVLTSQPVATVTIDVASDNADEGITNVSSVSFDASNWDAPQTVTVTGVDDLSDDGDIVYTIVTSAAVSSDAKYSGLDPSDVSVTNIDDDVPGIAIVPTAGLFTSEQGQSATFDIVLTSQPTSDVVINLASSDPGEGTLSQSSVTFTPGNFDTPQTITVQGVDDNVVDGNISYSIETSPVVSSDPVFSGIDPSDVSITNLDNDIAALTVTPVSSSEGSGAGPTLFVFDVTLDAEVDSGFRVDFATIDGTAIAADGDYVAGTGSLDFLGTQNEIQTITVVVNQDEIVEGDESFAIRLANITGIPAALAQRIFLPATPADGTIINDDTAVVTISGPAATAEGTSVSDTAFDFTVQLSNAVQGGFALAYSTSDGTALLADDDYTDNDATLIFLGNAGETQTISVAVRADDRIELDETFDVTLGALSDLPVTAADDITVDIAPVTATIVNDDFPQLILSDITANTLEGSGGTTTEFQFQVLLTDTVADADGFEVPFTVNDGTATKASGDFSASDGTIQFMGIGGETRTISVLVNHDLIVEDNETFSVTLGAISGLDPSQTVIIPINTLEATIENDDTAILTLSADALAQTEGGAFEFTVSLSAGVQDGLTIDYVTSDVTATTGDGDYTQASATLSFNGTANESMTFSIQSSQDSKVELDEAFRVALQTLAGLPPGVVSAITISDPLDLTILNDDSATITLSSPAAIDERDNGATSELVFDVTLSAPVQDGFSIDFQTVDGTAVSPSDFTAANGTLTFSGADAEVQTLRVQISGDQIVEADEVFQMTLGQISGLLAGLENDVVIQTGIATGTIANDDTATLSISGPGNLDEGTAGTPTDFVFTVTLSAAVQDGLTVEYSTIDGTATIADNDYQSNNGTLVFTGSVGETQSLTVAVNADDIVEPDETFSVSLGAIGGLPATAVDDVTILQGTAEAGIQNDDFARLILSDVTASNVEGTSASGMTAFEFTVTLTDAVNDPDGFDVPVTINDGTARVADGDYQDNDVLLHFDGTGSDTQTVTVLVNQDSILEVDETFTVTLGAITGLSSSETVLVDTSSLTATIEDDDTATLTLSTAQLSLDEGDTGTTDFVFVATLSAPVQGGFQVSHATNDLTATLADGDYLDNDATLSFFGAANETRQVTVRVNGDQTVEPDEMFEFALGAVTGLDADVLSRLSVVGSPIVATIVNDDTATLSIVGPGTINEGSDSGTTAFDFTVTLSAAISAGFDVSFQTSEGTATLADNDFIDNDGSITFDGTAGETQTIRVLVNHDHRVERAESFQVALGQVSGLDSALASQLSVDTAPVTATIGNDDTATIGFVADSSNVLEADGQHVVGVRLAVAGGGTLSEPVTVNVLVRDSSTATSADFTLTNSTITFAAGSMDGDTQNVQLTLVEDGLVEEIETIVLALELAAASPPDVTLTSIASHTVSVTDDSMDAILSGRVWVDANNDGTLNLGELTIPAVIIQLSGTTLGGESVDRETTTDSNGLYRFTDLAAGTYTVSQSQPAGFVDGQDIAGTVGGANSGSVTNDQFSEIEIGPSQLASDFNFGERGLQSTQVTRYRILSRPRTGGLLGNAITTEMLSSESSSSSNAAATTTTLTSNRSAEGERASNRGLGESISVPVVSPAKNSTPSVQQAGSQLIVTGTSSADQIRIVPADTSSENAVHQISVNGQQATYDAANIDSILVIANEGDDELILEDTTGDDRLRTERDRLVFENDEVRIEAIATEFVRAISNSGGHDQLSGDSDLSALDYVLQLEGDWDRIF